MRHIERSIAGTVLLCCKVFLESSGKIIVQSTREKVRYYGVIPEIL
jgi:L-lactate utilization protein LutC